MAKAENITLRGQRTKVRKVQVRNLSGHYPKAKNRPHYCG